MVVSKTSGPAVAVRTLAAGVDSLDVAASPESAFSIFNFTRHFAAIAPELAATVQPRQSAELDPALGREASISTLNSSNSEEPQRSTPPVSPRSAENGRTEIRSAAIDDGSVSDAGWSLRIILVWIWLGGVVLISARVFWFPLRLNVQLARRQTPTGPAAFEILEEAKRMMGVTRVLPIVQSRAVECPALMGFIRPWLLLPEGMAERFTPQELRFVFLHELAHLKRRDIAVNWLVTLLQILHWFNPLVWLAFSRMRADRELACDAIALSHANEGENKLYGQAIIKLLEDFTPPDMRTIAYDAFALNGGSSDIRFVGIDGTGDTLVIEHPASDRLLGWTASSDEVVFQSDRRGGWDAYTVDISNGAGRREPVLLRELGRGVSVLRLTGSGDLFFTKATRDVDVYFARIDPLSGKLQEEPVKAHRVEGRSQWPAWSPDGRSLAYTITENQDGVIGIRDIESGAIRELNSVTPRVSFPHWSNDGKSIYALSWSSGQRLLYRIGVGTSQTAIVTQGAPYWLNVWPLLSWAPDGKSLYHYADKHNAFKRVDVDTGKTVEFEIPSAGDCSFSVFSPDGKHLVRSLTTKDSKDTVVRTIRVMSVTGGESRQVVQLSGAEACEDMMRD